MTSINIGLRNIFQAFLWHLIRKTIVGYNALQLIYEKRLATARLSGNPDWSIERPYVLCFPRRRCHPRTAANTIATNPDPRGIPPH